MEKTINLIFLRIWYVKAKQINGLVNIRKHIKLNFIWLSFMIYVFNNTQLV